MKKFLSGVLCATLVFSLTLSALAISGKMTIEVDPINIMVNGEVFVPKDVNGKEVPQFAYQGTTYAPLRALAEAYGLEVGYDAEKNMATVSDPEAKPVATPAPDTTAKNDYSDWTAEDEAIYQAFKDKWEVIFDKASENVHGEPGWYYAMITDDEDAFNRVRQSGLKDQFVLRLITEINKHTECNVAFEVVFGEEGVWLSIVDGQPY